MEIVWGIILGEQAKNVPASVKVGEKRDKEIHMPLVYEKDINDIEAFRHEMHKRIDALLDVYKITRGIE